MVSFHDRDRDLLARDACLLPFLLSSESESPVIRRGRMRFSAFASRHHQTNLSFSRARVANLLNNSLKAG